MRRGLAYCGVVLAGLAVAALPKLARSADAADGNYVIGDPTVDISDFYSWVDPNENRVVFVVNVFSGVPSAASFNPHAQYVVHTTSVPSFGAPNGVDETIIATFDVDGILSLWVGTDEYVTGTATAETGLSSTDHKVKVFAGKRQDPFFCNLKGINAMTSAIAKTPLTLDTAGCPLVDAGTAATFATDLRTTPIPDGGVVDGGTDGGPIDAFAKSNVLSIVISLDKSLVTKGGPLVSAWASTHTVGQ